MVQADKPQRTVMNSSKAAGRLVLWVIELGEFNVQYRPRTMIKMQALADFIAEFTTMEDEEMEPMVWMIWIDGSSNQRARKARVLLRSSERDMVECVIRL